MARDRLTGDHERSLAIRAAWLYHGARAHLG